MRISNKDIVKGMASAVCCTHGRLHVLPDAVRSFIDQDYENKELIIINDHVGYPIYLEKENPQIKIYNFNKRFKSLGAKRNIAKNLASGEFIFIWEDDDISTPWRMSQSISILKENPSADAVNSLWALGSTDNKDYYISSNNFEGSTCFRSSYVKEREYNENKNITMDMDMQANANVIRNDCNPLFWYIYRWGLDLWHLSGCGTEDSKDNWINGLLYSKTDLGNTIKNIYLNSLWNDVDQFLKNNLNKENYMIWHSYIKDYL